MRSFEPLPRHDHPVPLVDKGVYLITGGLGGIGLALAESLARSHSARLVLVGRSAFPPREEWDSWPRLHHSHDEIADKISAIRSIEKAGGEVIVLAADVTDADAMRRVIATARERFGRINGVIHAAGVLEDALIVKKEAASASRVLAPKVKGTLVLESVLADDPPELFVVMSSVSALLAPPGQVDYAGANAFLDAFAAARSSSDRLTISIQWPRWRDVGLAADSHLNGKPVGAPLHPLLQKQIKNDESERTYESDLSLEQDWIVSEHRLRSGAALFPGTGYIEMVRAAFADQHRGGALSIRDLSFEAPLRVEAGSNQAIRLTIRKQGNQDTFTVAERAGAVSSDWIVCARGDVAFVDAVAARPESIEAIRERCNVRELTFDADRQNPKQERYINFGPRWRNLKKIFLGRGEALSVVELASQFTSDLETYHVHPALLDMATGSAMFLIPGYDRLEYLYVPVSYGSITIRGPLPARCYAYIRAKEGLNSDSAVATFDISILDESGSVIVEIRDYALQQIRDPAVLDRGKRTAGQHVPEASRALSGDGAASESADSISSQQGVQAFERLLSGWYAPNVTVFMSDLVAALEKSERAPGPVKSGVSRSADGEPPGDEIETTLASWWKELLGLAEVSRQDNFFEVGGQSLTAIRLMAKIKKTYGLELNSAVMFEAPTIDALARLIRKDDVQVSHSAVVPMQTQGSVAPLFVIHALGGRVIGYNELLRHLKRTQPVYGVEFDYAATQADQMRMEYLAAHYIEEIRAVQARGPYYLLGYSFGGLMAFEMAQQLHSAGERVAFLGMLDTWQTGHIKSLDEQRSPPKRLLRQVELRILHAKSMLASRDPSTLRSKLQERTVRFWNNLTGLGLRTIYATFGAFGLAVPRGLQRAQDVNWFAVSKYTARQYPGRLTLFRAEEGIGAVDDRYGEELGWGGLATLGVEVHKVPGGHLELMREPNVGILAREVSACLERCQGEVTRAGRGVSVSDADKIGSVREAEGTPKLQLA